MNLQLFSKFNGNLETSGPLPTLSKAPASDHDKVVLHMAELEKAVWLYIPILLMLAFAMGFMIGRRGRIRRKLQVEELDHASQSRAGNSQNNSANGLANNDNNRDSEERETNNMNAEGLQHDIRFGKAALPSTAYPDYIISEMAQMVLREGEQRGRTSEQVWDIDSKKKVLSRHRYKRVALWGEKVSRKISRSKIIQIKNFQGGRP